MNENVDILKLICKGCISTYSQFRIHMDVRGLKLTKELFSEMIHLMHYAEMYDFLINVFSENCEFQDCFKRYTDVFLYFMKKFEHHTLMYYNPEKSEELKNKYGYNMGLVPFLKKSGKQDLEYY